MLSVALLVEHPVTCHAKREGPPLWVFGGTQSRGWDMGAGGGSAIPVPSVCWSLLALAVEHKLLCTGILPSSMPH